MGRRGRLAFRRQDLLAGAAFGAGIDDHRDEDDEAGNRLLQVYTMSGALAGLSGLLWVGRYSIAFTELAAGFEMTVIASCVIGGVSTAGGIGNVMGALLGVLFTGVINGALPVIHISPFWQQAISGFVILVAVIVNARSERRAGKQILPPKGKAAASSNNHSAQLQGSKS